MSVILREKGFAIPDLDQVRTLALQLHKEGKPFHDRVWGWQVTYEPEMGQENALVQVPDGNGGVNSETRRIWAPASFTIGENGIWFFSLLWEEGPDHAPVEFLEEGNLQE